MKTTLFAAFAVAVATTGCSKHNDAAATEDKAMAAQPSGELPAPSARPIVLDGSSTVFPISEAMAEEFQKSNAARVTVASSGTGGGFKKLCAKEIAIAGASRPIKPS